MNVGFNVHTNIYSPKFQPVLKTLYHNNMAQWVGDVINSVSSERNRGKVSLDWTGTQKYYVILKEVSQSYDVSAEMVKYYLLVSRLFILTSNSTKVAAFTFYYTRVYKLTHYYKIDSTDALSLSLSQPCT